MRIPLPILCVSASIILTSLGCGEPGGDFLAEVRTFRRYLWGWMPSC